MVARRLSGLEKPSRELVVQVLGVVAVLTSWCLRTATSEVVGVPGSGRNFGFAWEELNSSARSGVATDPLYCENQRHRRIKENQAEDGTMI
ncbi:hypothetical protein U1Q18_034349 [Sarracenia purpurea var. burkii]